MSRSITRRRLLAALPIAVLGAGCSALGGSGSSVKSGPHQIVIDATVEEEHTLAISITGNDQSVLFDSSVTFPPRERTFEALRFEGEPNSIETTIDDNDSVSHQWPSPDCGDDEMSGVTIHYGAAVAADEVGVEGICTPSEYLQTRSDTTG